MRVVLVLTATILTPSGKTHYPKIEDNKDGTVTIRYQPTESGLHELDVRYNKEPIQGTTPEPRRLNRYTSRSRQHASHIPKLRCPGLRRRETKQFNYLETAASCSQQREPRGKKERG